MKWNESYRKLFFDYHNAAENHSIAKDFDAEKFAKQLEAVGCEVVSVFALGGKGHKYYRKGQYGIVHPQLPEGVDMVEDVVRECHKRNIKVLGYVGYGISPALLRSHPEFIHVENENGDYLDDGWTGIRPCKIGYGAEYLRKQYEELCLNYDLDYFFLDGSYVNEPCFCPYCRENFTKDTGYQIPTDKEGLVWKIYLNWFHGQMERVRKDVRETVHKAKPGIEVMINWSYSYRSPDPVPEDIDLLFADVPFRNELEGIDICTRSFALTGKKFEIHNTAFLKVWGEWGLKNPTVLKRAAALLLANGTNVHMGYQFFPRFHVEDGVWDTFKEVFDWTKEREAYLKNNEIKPYIGAYYSNKQHGLTHTGDIWSEPMWLYGYNKLMIDCGLHYNMLGSEYMKATINQFSAVFLPDMRYITDEEVAIIEEYVANGGTVIASGLVGTADDLGCHTQQCKLENVLGIKWAGQYDETHCYTKIIDESLKKNTSNMALTMEAPTGLVTTTTATKLAALYGIYKNIKGGFALTYSPPENDTGYAAVTINDYGKGKAIYFASDYSQAYYQTFQWNLVEMVKNLLFDMVKIEERLKVTGDGTCEVTLAKRGDATQVHLVNMVGTMPNTMRTNGHCMPKEVVVMSDISVEVIHDKQPEKVIMRPQNIELPFEAEANKVKFVIPKVGLYEIIEIV